MLRALLVLAAPLAAQALPPLPDPAGVGTHVLALARAPDGAVWVGTYGQGIYVMRPGAAGWEQMRHSADTAARSISWDFVHAFAFGPGGEIWYGTVGNGWGVSTDGGKTWTNWELKQLGPEWQYVAPNGIVTRGDTVYVGTADGIKLSGDRGASWAEITDSAGAGTAPHPLGRIASQYVLALAAGPDGSLWAAHLHGVARSSDGGRSWTEFPAPSPCDPARCVNEIRALAPDSSGGAWVGTERGLYRLDAARGLWIDRRGRSSCGRGPVVKGCRTDLPPVARLARAGSGDLFAATPDGVFATARGWAGTPSSPRESSSKPPTAPRCPRSATASWFSRGPPRRERTPSRSATTGSSRAMTASGSSTPSTITTRGCSSPPASASRRAT